MRRFLNQRFVTLSKILKSPHVYGFPYVLLMEPTNRCNLRCPLCPINKMKRKIGDMEFKNYTKVIDEMKDVLQLLLLWNYGEPFLNKKIFDMIKYAKNHGIRVETCTNGNLLDKKMAERIADSGLDKITIPIDGTTQKSYSKYRVGGKLKNVISGVELLVEKRGDRKSPEIFIDFIVMKHNKEEIPVVKALKESLKVNQLNFKTLNVYGDFRSGRAFLPKEMEFSRYSSKKDGGNFCARLWDSSVVNWDGTVSPCCYDYDCNHNFGNAFEDGFKKVWNSKKYMAFRKTVLSNRSNINLCKNCPADFENMYL